MAKRLQVFISGTMRDLEDVREQVASVISSMGLEAVWAEQHGARNRSPREECELLARTCDIYLGIFGLPYGFRVPPDNSLSATEFEWQTARKHGRPMLIYHQRGTAEADQAAFVARALEWQKGNFSHRFEAPSELATFVRTDLSNLIAENFRPAPSDEQFRIQLSMSLENLGYAVTSDCFVGGLRIPILAEHCGLVLPQVLMIGWQPNHLDILRDAVLADRNRYSSAVYIVGEDSPERLPDLIRAVALENLLNLAGPGVAKAQLRRGASEWRALGSRRVMDWQQFERLSDFRRQIRLQLDESELAYALRCSIQHGKNLPFWCKANSANARAIDVVLEPLLESCGRRPLLRAGYAMERLDPDLRQAALAKARANRGISDLAGAVLAAAEACRTRESWDQELRLLLESWGFRSQLRQEVSEPED